MLRPTTGFHAHDAGRAVGRVFQELGSLELHITDLTRLGFNPVGPEDALGQINTTMFIAVAFMMECMVSPPSAISA